MDDGTQKGKPTQLPQGFDPESYRTSEGLYDWTAIINEIAARIVVNAAKMEEENTMLRERLERLEGQEKTRKAIKGKRLRPNTPEREEYSSADEDIADEREETPGKNEETVTTKESEETCKEDDRNPNPWIDVVHRKKKSNAGIYKIKIRNEKPREPMNVGPETIERTLLKVGIPHENGIRIRHDKRSEAFVITTKNEGEFEKLKQIGSFTKNDGSNVGVKVISGLPTNHIRGVIYAWSDEISPENLRNAKCATHKIVSANFIGKRNKTAMFTFEGKDLPEKVYIGQVIRPVVPYTPRPVVCFRCHKIGHKAEECKSKNEACRNCGKTHTADVGNNCSANPTCANCGGEHLAFSYQCPKRAPIKADVAPRTKGQVVDKTALKVPIYTPVKGQAPTSASTTIQMREMAQETTEKTIGQANTRTNAKKSFAAVIKADAKKVAIFKEAMEDCVEAITAAVTSAIVTAMETATQNMERAFRQL